MQVESEGIPSDQVAIVSLARLSNPAGEVRRFFREGMFEDLTIREVYMSDIAPGAVKAWKRHREASLFLTCVSGEIRFVWSAYPDKRFVEISFSATEPKGILIPNGTWFGFQGLGEATATLVSASSHLHDPSDVEERNLQQMDFRWGGM